LRERSGGNYLDTHRNRDEDSNDVLLLAWSDAARDCRDERAVAAFVTALLGARRRPNVLADPAPVIAATLGETPAAALAFFEDRAAWAPESSQVGTVPPAIRVVLQMPDVVPDTCAALFIKRLLDVWRGGTSIMPANSGASLGARIPASACEEIVRRAAGLSVLPADAESLLTIAEFRTAYLHALSLEGSP